MSDLDPSRRRAAAASPDDSALDHSPRDRRRLGLALLAWIPVAMALSAAGALQRLPRPAIPLLIWLPALATGFAFWRSARVRACLRSIDLRWLVGYHLVRIVFGAGFLWLHAEGRLAARFATTAGWGDIVAGVLAIAVLALVGRRAETRGQRALLLGWNLVALADILLVFVTAQSIFFGPHPEGVDVLRTFPWSLVGLGVVSLILITHGLVFDRLRAGR